MSALPGRAQARHKPPLIRGRMGWQQQAQCRGEDPEVFFVGKGESTRPAKDICRRCPVTAECLAAAIANGEEHGVFGGLTKYERRALVRSS